MDIFAPGKVVGTSALAMAMLAMGQWSITTTKTAMMQSAMLMQREMGVNCVSEMDDAMSSAEISDKDDPVYKSVYNADWESFAAAIDGLL